jgi:ribosomal protein S21
MAQVIREQGESIERLISRLRRVVIRKGVLKQARQNMFHHKKESKKTERDRAQYREQSRAKAEKGL